MPLKSLKPSMREKKRYLLVRGSGKLRENIYNSVKDFLGTAGMAKVSLNFIRVDTDGAIVSVNRESLDQVRAAICIWPEKMGVLRVSGTIKGLKTKEKLIS